MALSRSKELIVRRELRIRRALDQFSRGGGISDLLRQVRAAQSDRYLTMVEALWDQAKGDRGHFLTLVYDWLDGPRDGLIRTTTARQLSQTPSERVLVHRQLGDRPPFELYLPYNALANYGLNEIPNVRAGLLEIADFHAPWTRERVIRVASPYPVVGVLAVLFHLRDRFGVPLNLDMPLTTSQIRREVEEGAGDPPDFVVLSHPQLVRLLAQAKEVVPIAVLPAVRKPRIVGPSHDPGGPVLAVASPETSSDLFRRVAVTSGDLSGAATADARRPDYADLLRLEDRSTVVFSMEPLAQLLLVDTSLDTATVQEETAPRLTYYLCAMREQLANRRSETADFLNAFEIAWGTIKGDPPNAGYMLHDASVRRAFELTPERTPL